MFDKLHSIFYHVLFYITSGLYIVSYILIFNMDRL